MSLGPGTRLGPYEILEPLGHGGMGEVYRARHLKLQRDVAIKVLPPAVAGDPWRLARFEREARTASALNHPNIITIHDIAEHEGTTYIAMELVEGRTLRELIAGGPLPATQVLRYAEQIADGLARAHAAGIVHRDIKPANVMITADERVKILDFGLAKPLPGADRPAAEPGVTTETQEGLIVGTPHYMSPEQCSGDTLDFRSDQFAFGVLVHEMVAGKPPFDGPSGRAIMSAILVGASTPLRKLRPDVPQDLERIVARCLEKDPARRFPSTAELATELHQVVERQAGRGLRLRDLLRRPAVAAALAVVVVAAGIGTWMWARGAGRRWAGGPAIAEITRLTEQGDLYHAYRTLRRALGYRPDDPTLTQMIERISLPAAVHTRPEGAEVEVKGYRTPDESWERLGQTPLQLRLPYAMMRWRITKAGYEPFEGAPFSSSAIGALIGGLPLDTLGAHPAGMVHIPGGQVIMIQGVNIPEELPPVVLDPFYLDRYEVTNRQFQEFVSAGGYRKEEYWPRPIERDGRAIPWSEAMAAFVDGTGRPGPAGWEAGSYATGRDDYPVSGISWYEAAAYCTFAGKSLPTVYHWFGAIGQDQQSDILIESNVDGTAKAPVGKFQGLGAFGTYDMAGNVKEWAWNATGQGRYILGGSWNEPGYVFKHLVAGHPFGREPTNGVRCARYPTPIPERLLAPVDPERHYQRPKPMTDETFVAVRGLYAYDHTPLDAREERVNDSLPQYRRETVSIRTAYGDGRMEINLLLPRDLAPPYQAVIWFPGADVYLHRSSHDFASSYLFDFLPKAGRVVVYPIYKGMYERFEPPSAAPSARRDDMIRWTQDISRTIDYLETRPDIDASRIGYYALSGGAVFGPVFTAVEPRIKASILLGGGLIPIPFRPETDPALFAPRSRTPTLMINGHDDFLMPYDLSEQPFFNLLGAPPGEKRLARLPGGHIPTDRRDVIREVLDWLDKWLGPVERTTAAVGK
jgi:predicted Ser/Thr protein kinase